jgi:hypothetical protein
MRHTVFGVLIATARFAVIDVTPLHAIVLQLKNIRPIGVLGDDACINYK